MEPTIVVILGVVAVLAVAAAVLWGRRRGRTELDRTGRPAHSHDRGVLEAKGMAEAHRNHQQSGGFGF